jgi:hypothetical protein
MHAGLVDGTLQSFVLASDIIWSNSSYQITTSKPTVDRLRRSLAASPQVTPGSIKEIRAQVSRGKTLNSTGSSMLKAIGLPSA